jgi:hypothetical protein
VIDMRPVYHQTADRVAAHIFVAALAFLIHRAIEKTRPPGAVDGDVRACAGRTCKKVPRGA